MAQSDFAEKIEDGELQIESTDVMTGGRNRNRFLYYQLKMSMSKADRIDMIVSFLMESGVRMILTDLKAALERGAKVRILTGNYLGITQPSALYLIKRELGDQVDLRFYSDKRRSFHPKSYIFHYENGGEIYIGSSNISRSALTSGIEWNYRFNSRDDRKNFRLFYDTFTDLFENHSIVIDEKELARYSKSWHKPAVSKDLAKYDELEEATGNVEPFFQPRGAQIESLYALENSRAEGAVKGLVQAATGVGKTYLAAFDSAKYKRVLFVAHREEILRQAAVSFRNVLDFIGNYEKAGRAPRLLSGGKDLGGKTAFSYSDIEYPDDCIVDFDMRLIDLFRELDRRSLSVRERIRQEYYRVKELFNGKVPTRMELFTYMEDDIYQYCMKHAKENPFRRYLEFLKEMDELSAEEEAVYAGIGREFLTLIETTDMQKVYKMPILYSFYHDGDVRLAVTDAEVLQAWKEFFDHGTNWKDFAAGITYDEYKAMTDAQHLSKAKSMPIRFLRASGKGFFVEKEGYALAAREELEEVVGSEAFKGHMKDILEYRKMEYYRRRCVGECRNGSF